MKSQAPDLVYIACDLSDRQTLREYGRACAASHAAAETRLNRATRALRGGRHGSHRRGRLSPRAA